MKKIIIIPFVLLVGCSDSGSSSDKEIKIAQTNSSYPIKPLKIDNGEEEGWGADIRLSVTSITENDTTNVYKVVSIYENRDIGFLVSVPKKKEGAKGFGSGIVFKSIGEESDHFLWILSKLYKEKMDTSIRFTNSISLNYVNLNEFAKSLGANQTDIRDIANEYKLFFEAQNGEDYAELYLNINPNEHWIELKEKDEEYRPQIIKFLKK